MTWLVVSGAHQDESKDRLPCKPVATWSLFKKAGWWEAVAVTAAAVGFAVLIPYWIAASHAGETNPAFNVLVHALGNIGVLVLLRVSSLEHWVDRHVLAGR